MGFLVLLITNYPGSELWRVTIILGHCFLRQKCQIWLVPAGDRFCCSAKPCSNRVHGRGEGESVRKTQWAATRGKNWEERIKEIKQVFNTSDTCEP